MTLSHSDSEAISSVHKEVVPGREVDSLASQERTKAEESRSEQRRQSWDSSPFPRQGPGGPTRGGDRLKVRVVVIRGSLLPWDTHKKDSGGLQESFPGNCR